MRRAVLKYGVISGLVSAALMLSTVRFVDDLGAAGAVWGYTGMVLAFLFVFFGVRSFRDREQGGQITFGRAFVVGLGITLISCLFYVAAWEFVYFKLTPDFWDKYSASVLAKYEASGTPPDELAKRRQEMADFKKLYDQPLYNSAMTFIEPFPVGLLITLVSAAALRRKNAP